MRWSPILVFSVACTTPWPDTSSTEQELNGMEGMFEFAIDLPWRMEPHTVNNVTTFDRVPITIVIDDEDTNVYSSTVLVQPRLFDFCKLTLSRVRNGTPMLTETFYPQDLEWIELTRGYWPTEQEGLPAPTNAVCHPHTEDCTAFTRVHDTSEWHALLAWDPGPMPTDYGEILELTAYVSGDDEGCDSHPIKLRNYARAYWAGYALPRFQGDDRWLYGDLHYHSQSTDNEGESGYSYRASVQAMGALGMDFTFATDHASSSEQIVSVDHQWLTDPFNPHEVRRGVRDLNQPRWDWAESALHGPTGANHELAAGWPADRARVPRMFLGAEVDVVPEVDYTPTTVPDSPFWHLAYGDQRDVDLAAWVDDGWETFFDYVPTFYQSKIPDIFHQMIDGSGRTEYRLADTQGLDEVHTGRQHLLYIPRFAEQPLGLVPSLTGVYGGASRRLVEGDGTREGVLPEIARKEGIAFLAHPLAAGGAGKGPGILPYSDYQYGKMFDQRALVGLQLWNEDERFSSAGGDYDVTGYEWLDINSDGGPAGGWIVGEYNYVPMYDLAHWGWGHVSFAVEENLHNGAYVWDRMLRWGLDEGRTRGIAWLPAGEPRRMFMAGGSDAHGDFNYHRNGYVTRTDSATATAFGKVRNLVQTGTPRVPCTGRDPACTTATSTQDQVADALEQGRFAVTDGPAVRLMVDRNRDGQIDDNDYPMGSVVDLYNGEALPILVQWESTPEFGDVEKIDLYVGADSSATAECPTGVCPSEYRARTYAPADHGVRRDALHERDLYRENIGDQLPSDPPADCDATFGPCVMLDGYWKPQVLKGGTNLRIIPDSSQGRFGTKQVTLNLDNYPTAFGAPTRVYVRAFVKTRAPCDPLTSVPLVAFNGRCVSRYGFTNPVWALRKTVRGVCPYSERSLDRDLDGLPDFCDTAPDAPASLARSRAFGGASNDSAEGVAFDSKGNSYVAGTVLASGRIERDAIATTPFSAAASDAILVKYDPSGRYAQHVQALGSGTASFTDVAADALGNVYVTGIYTGQMILGGTTLTASDTDAFVAKLQGSDLAVQWVYRLGGAGDTRATALAVTGDGRVSVAGAFAGTLTFPGSIASEGKHDCFVIRLSVSGVQQNIQRFGGAGDCTATGIALDANERAYAAATYTGALRVGAVTRTTASTDSAIVRLGNPSETYAILGTSWLGDPASAADDDVVAGVAVTSTGTVVAVGNVLGRISAAVDGGTFTALDTVIGPAARDGFVVTLAPADGTVSLPPVSRIGGEGDDGLQTVATDSAGHVVIGGYFNSTAVTTPAGTLARTGTTNAMMFVLDPALAIAWQRRAGITGVTTVVGAGFSRDGRFALGGTITGRGQVDDSRTLVTAGGHDGFIAVFRTP